MGSHGVFHAGVRVLNVVHGDVAVVVAHLGGGHGRSGGAGSVRGYAARALILVVPVAGRRLALRTGLTIVLPTRHLSAAAIVSPRRAGRIGVALLPLGVHGGRRSDVDSKEEMMQTVGIGMSCQTDGWMVEVESWKGERAGRAL